MEGSLSIDRTQTAVAHPRKLFMVLSPRSLGYASYALESLFRNSVEPIHLHLITDSFADREILTRKMTEDQKTGGHAWSVFTKEDLKEREAASFADYPKLRAFRDGHPCWRKITDPVLLSGAGDEMIVLDPDIYFPNRFTFETTLSEGLLLMWQKPNCLFPPAIVHGAMRQNIRLARHVDIGVAHWRAPVDLDWIEWLLDRLGSANFPRLMHIEAIVWAAIGMRIGGGYLPPDLWHCWHRSQPKRVLLKVGVSGRNVLRHEPFAKMKCFHAGGEAKNWIAGAEERGSLEGGNLLNQQGEILPFVELTPNLYRWEQRVKTCLKRLGYYNVFQSA
jgi:hypothetical protein